MSKVDSYVDSFPTAKKSHLATIFLATLLLLAVSSMDSKFESYSVTGPRAANKPFPNFESFYPFYLSEHSDITNRRLHLLGTTIILLFLLANPMLVPCMLSGVLAGFLVCNPLSGLSHGLYEGILMVLIFLSLAKYNNLLSKAFMCLFIGYGFAWVGHFKFEQNRPATFIYPSFSFTGDFRMWYDAMTGKIPK